jgi:lipid-binding SYLF domain-containing protein
MNRPARLAQNLISLLLAVSLGALAGCSTADKQPEKRNLDAVQVSQERERMLTMAKTALGKLYATDPEARAAVEGAVGYGVFDITTVNALLVVGARGPGVIFDNASGKPTYMRAVRVGTGPGLGYQTLYQIFVFKSRAALDQFKIGGKAGGDVGASATAGSGGKAISFNPYIDVYQVTEKGLALQANWGGAAYYVDPDLN